MILSAQLPPVAYRHPWNIGFEDRIRMLCSRNRHVLYFYEYPDTSTFRYRVFNMVEGLNSAPDLDISASWFSLSDSERMDKFIDRAHVLVLCRARYGPSLDRILSRARLRKIPVFYDVDDLVFNPDFVALIIDSLDQDRTVEKVWDNWFAYTGRYGTTLKRCDAAITTNRFLADRVTEYEPRLTPHVIPNFLNRCQQERSCAIYDAKIQSGFERDENITIGYFSGTPTHNRDFQVAADAISEVMDSDPRIILRVVGFLNTESALQQHRNRVECFPVQDFLNLQTLIGGVEVNVAPLQNNTFTNCKSELKYFEAAILGTLTIASPTFNFCNSISDCENGFLSSAHQWREKIELACETITDRDKHLSIVERAHQHAIHSYGWNRFADKIASTLFGA